MNKKAIDLIKIVRSLEANKDKSKNLIIPLSELYDSKVKEIRGYIENIEDSGCYSNAVKQFERLVGRGRDAISMNQRLYHTI